MNDLKWFWSYAVFWIMWKYYWIYCEFWKDHQTNFRFKDALGKVFQYPKVKQIDVGRLFISQTLQKIRRKTSTGRPDDYTRERINGSMTGSRGGWRWWIHLSWPRLSCKVSENKAPFLKKQAFFNKGCVCWLGTCLAKPMIPSKMHRRCGEKRDPLVCGKEQDITLSLL